jgi:hypothetical protein
LLGDVGELVAEQVSGASRVGAELAGRELDRPVSRDGQRWGAAAAPGAGALLRFRDGRSIQINAEVTLGSQARGLG